MALSVSEVTPEQTARILGVSRSSVRRLRNAGLLTDVRVHQPGLHKVHARYSAAQVEALRNSGAHRFLIARSRPGQRPPVSPASQTLILLREVAARVQTIEDLLRGRDRTEPPVG